MCIVIDTNAFHSVFDSNSSDFGEFGPVLFWIKDGNGKIVFGGTKYKEELRSATKYLKLFMEFAVARKTVEIPDEDVDREEERIKELINHRDFDDQHLIAIVSISGCKLICTKDKRSHQFIRDNNLYQRHVKRPKIYSNSSHAEYLLRDRNIAKICTR